MAAIDQIAIFLRILVVLQRLARRAVQIFLSISNQNVERRKRKRLKVHLGNIASKEGSFSPTGVIVGHWSVRHRVLLSEELFL